MPERSLLDSIRRRLTPEQESPASRIPLPPEEMQMGVGRATADHYLRVGRILKEDIRSRTGVSPTASVLDIGCGSGRLARHFADYIERSGRYVGMDIQKRFVDWCEENISRANPAFEFYHQDIYNGHYNPGGKYRASEYRFPFENESFDLVVLTSVFTHMLPEDASNYLKEISRLLKPGGHCYATWFLLGHDVEVKYLVPDVMEAQVGYGFRYCVDLLEECGLVLAREPFLGSWQGEGSQIGQDVLVLGRARDGSPSLRPETAAVPDDALTEEPEKAEGALRSMDPIGHSVTLMVGEEPETFYLAEGAEIEVNGQEADSSSLRRGQAVSLRSVSRPEDGVRVALALSARDRPQADRVKGIIENVDLEHGTLTVYAEGKYRTFEIDPENARVRVNGELVRASELKAGQRTSLRYIPKIEALGASDRSRQG